MSKGNSMRGSSSQASTATPKFSSMKELRKYIKQKEADANKKWATDKNSQTYTDLLKVHESRVAVRKGNKEIKRIEQRLKELN